MRGRKAKHQTTSRKGTAPAKTLGKSKPHPKGFAVSGKKGRLRLDKMARGGGIHIKKSHKGLLHKDLGVAEGKPIPEAKLQKAKNSKDPKVRRRATFAENAKHWNHG